MTFDEMTTEQRGEALTTIVAFAKTVLPGINLAVVACGDKSVSVGATGDTEPLDLLQHAVSVVRRTMAENN